MAALSWALPVADATLHCLRQTSSAVSVLVKYRRRPANSAWARRSARVEGEPGDSGMGVLAEVLSLRSADHFIHIMDILINTYYLTLERSAGSRTILLWSDHNSVGKGLR